MKADCGATESSFAIVRVYVQFNDNDDEETDDGDSSMMTTTESKQNVAFSFSDSSNTTALDSIDEEGNDGGGGDGGGSNGGKGDGKDDGDVEEKWKIKIMDLSIFRFAISF